MKIDKKTPNKKINSLIATLLAIEKRIALTASRPVKYSPALVNYNSVPIFRRGTVNVIQGRAGSHKSRLAQLFGSLLIRKKEVENDFLGFDKNKDIVTVCYLDTERNLEEEYPEAVHSIRTLAGYSAFEEVENFRFTSLKNTPKKLRLEAVKSFVEAISRDTQSPLFLILDIATNCISNFNDPIESLELLDYFGNLCEEFKATVLMVIHENPGTDKARENLGTEALNKASTVLSLGREGELIKLKFLKTRHPKPLRPLFLVVNETDLSLQLADRESIRKATEARQKKAPLDEVREILWKFLQHEATQQELIENLRREFQCSVNTVKSRLVEIVEHDIPVPDEDAVECKLHSKVQNGKPTLYWLEEYNQS